MKKEAGINKTLFIILMIILYTPMVQQITHIVNETPLRGAIKKVNRPYFTWHDWFSGKYQADAEKYLNTHFGFRNAMVRVNNQIYYTLFKKAKANGVIIGKKNYLYEYSYIDAYYGTDFLGKDSIYRQLKKLKAVQDTLEAQGKTLLLVMAPGKATFFPEYIPDRYKRNKGVTNLQYFAKYASKLGINHINLSKWFLMMKDTARYALYPKTGIHWSYYGMALAADTIIKTVEKLRGTDMPDIIWKGIKMSSKLKNTDRDIERGMNLIFHLKNNPMPYPQLEVDTTGKNRLNAIVIADSYYWQIFSAKLPHRIFNKQEFWFYNKQIFPKRKDGTSWTNESDLLSDLNNTDIVILLCTEPVLKRLFWGFIDNAYEAYFQPDKYKKNHSKINIDKTKIARIIEKIKNNEKWYNKEIEKAEQKNISIDSMLKLDAVYLLRKREKDNK
jgi:hypothetical protein